MTSPPKRPLKSLLGRHRLLAPSASVWVSPICLGAMNFGEAWNDILGECSKETAFEMLDYFYDMGGNFVDTAPNYQAGQSEEWLGEWMTKHGRRDEMVLATKYTGPWKSMSEPEKQQSNFGGTGSKSLRLSIEGSLKRLQTDYIDVFYVHVWDYNTSIPELMHSLNNLVVSGKVIYLAISDTPAWIVAKCNEYARNNGLRQFSVYQGRWSAAERDFERDIIPMTKSEGMALCPWGALGGGYFKPKKQKKEGGRTLNVSRTAQDEPVADVLEKIANKRSTAMTSVALAYVIHKTPYVFPICGGRKVEHLKGNIEALGLELSQEEVDDIEAAYPFDVGFPMNFLSGGNPKGPKGPEDVGLGSHMPERMSILLLVASPSSRPKSDEFGFIDYRCSPNWRLDAISLTFVPVKGRATTESGHTA